MKEKEYLFNNEWLIEKVEDDAILFNEKKNMVVVMNEAGLNIINILKEKKKYDVLVKEYMDIYFANSSIEKDLDEAFNKLVKTGVIIIV